MLHLNIHSLLYNGKGLSPDWKGCLRASNIQHGKILVVGNKLNY